MTRIWLRDLPQLLHDMLTHALGVEENVKVLVAKPGRAGPSVAPDVVIGGDDPGNPQWAYDLLRQWPNCRVLIVESGGHRASLFEMRPHRTALGEMSLDELVRVVTSVARDPRYDVGPGPGQTGSSGYAPRVPAGSEITSRNRRDKMNEQPGAYEFSGENENAQLAKLVAAVLAIHADLQARPGAASPEVKKAIEAANLLVELLNNDVSLPEAPRRPPTADVDEILRSLSSLRSTQA